MVRETPNSVLVPQSAHLSRHEQASASRDRKRKEREIREGEIRERENKKNPVSPAASFHVRRALRRRRESRTPSIDRYLSREREKKTRQVFSPIKKNARGRRVRFRPRRASRRVTMRASTRPRRSVRSAPRTRTRPSYPEQAPDESPFASKRPLAFRRDAQYVC